VPTRNLGNALTGTFPVPGGSARVFERGAILSGTVGDVEVQFAFPSIGVPVIAPTAAAAPILEPGAVTFQIGGWQMATVGAALAQTFAERIALAPTGRPASATPLALGAPVVVVPPSIAGVQATYGVGATASLEERVLYDIAVKADDGTWQVIAPHAVYYRSEWHDFGIVHVTDIHLARRIDYFPRRLEAAGRSDSARNMSNWNDRFRGFIKYANYLHRLGVIDVILATGDIIDYLFEEDDDQSGGGNALFARNMILGRVPGVAVPDVEELHVPIFIIAGNHDYRVWPYKLFCNLDIGIGVSVRELPNFAGYKMDRQDALLAQVDIPVDHPPLLG
jgi:hypothetical protein